MASINVDNVDKDDDYHNADKVAEEASDLHL